MPFISKKRFYDLYLQPSFQSRPDVALLLLAIKLITTLPTIGLGHPRTALYHATRHFYVEIEGAFSILVLQAAVLVALYELGHGIYPAAYLSIGACSRYAYALGINASRTVPARKVLTLVEVEERRRVWWAIVILDRFVLLLAKCFHMLIQNSFVSIGCPGRPFATTDPRLSDLLPADDDKWDQGVSRFIAFLPSLFPLCFFRAEPVLIRNSDCQSRGSVRFIISNDRTYEQICATVPVC